MTRTVILVMITEAGASVRESLSGEDRSPFVTGCKHRQGFLSSLIFWPGAARQLPICQETIQRGLEWSRKLQLMILLCRLETEMAKEVDVLFLVLPTQNVSLVSTCSE